MWGEVPADPFLYQRLQGDADADRRRAQRQDNVIRERFATIRRVDALRLDVTVLGEGIRDRGLTLSDLARRLGVSYAAVHSWERGEGCPRPQALVQLAAVLGVPPERLIGADPAAVTLAQMRVCAGLTTRVMAERLGIPVMAYNRIERGVGRPVTGDELALIAGVLAVPLDAVRAAVQRVARGSLRATP